MRIIEYIDQILGGGPGSGCHGDNCGRPEGSGGAKMDKTTGEVKVGDAVIGNIKETASEIYESRPGQKYADTKKKAVRYRARSTSMPSYPATYFDSKKQALAHLEKLHERSKGAKV